MAFTSILMTRETLFKVNTEDAEQIKKQYRIDIYDNFVIRVVAFIDIAKSPFLFKIWDENGHTCKISQVSHATMKNS